MVVATRSGTVGPATGGVTTTAITPAPAVPFALAPALVMNTILDYSSTAGIKLYQEAVKPLSHDDRFDISSDGLYSFLSKLKARVNTAGWTNIVTIPQDASISLTVGRKSLLEAYGEITL